MMHDIVWLAATGASQQRSQRAKPLRYAPAAERPSDAGQEDKGCELIRRRSYLSITLHLLWATRDRHPLLTPEIEARLYDYLAAVAHRNGCDMLAIGGTENHVHLLLTLPGTIRVSDLLRDLKGGSSHFMQETLKPGEWFDWQNNYAALSVSPGHRKRIIAYIHNQKQHHAEGTVEEMLERDGETYETEPASTSDGNDTEGT